MPLVDPTRYPCGSIAEDRTHKGWAVAATTTEGLKKLLAAQPPETQGEGLLDLWDQLWTKELASVQVNTVEGISDDKKNYVFPYEKIRAVVGDGGNWKWPRMWQRFDELERRGTYHEFSCGEVFQFIP